MMNNTLKTTLILRASLMLSSCLNKITGDYIPIDKGIQSVTDPEQLVKSI